MAWIEIVEGPFRGISIPLNSKLTIGRNICNDLFLNESSVSRRHAEIWVKGEHFALIDLGSSNGTVLNKKLLGKFLPNNLNNNDEFVIGLNRFTFHSDTIPIEKVKKIPVADDKAKGTTLSKTDLFPVVAQREFVAEQEDNYRKR